ncbi:MAG: flavohemoprotein [Actinobacteria bacterium]|nr:flavohemoprotein [Actinomycetota bacterium]
MASSDGGRGRPGTAGGPGGVRLPAGRAPEGHPTSRNSTSQGASAADRAQLFFSADPAEGTAPVPPGHPLSRLFAAIEPVSDSAMTYFYGHLFAIEPQIRAMFPPAMDTQRKRFYQALTRIAASGDGDALAGYLEGLGRAHRKFGVQKDHFDAFAQALAATWQRYAPDAWAGAAVEWDDLFHRVSRAMVAAADRDAEQSPPWWLAEIVAHEVRAPGLAVLTLLPSQPVPFQPGQHISIQTPRWPRLWRTYSVANAPRDDDTLTLHVRAVPGGLVSAALVHHGGVGDTLLLGAADGTMTADTSSGRDVLCLAGGTGLAPVKAIVEALVKVPGARPEREIVLYHGARHEAGLYDLPDLRHLERNHPWLQVIPVVSEEAAPDAIFGSIPDVVGLANWQDRDIYVAGPDDMIARTVTELKDRGAPEERLHYDCPMF